jgi:hypothetical protein
VSKMLDTASFPSVVVSNLYDSKPYIVNHSAASFSTTLRPDCSSGT